ncbi:MAG: hypothetical protein QOH24_1136 [Verrucomicrobiota bacterium]|jgi:uncharacterized membrane protein
MADPIDPSTPPPSSEPPLSNPGGPSSTGLPSNVAAALACFPLIGGLIFWFLEKRDPFVRFYAMQSIIFGAAWLLFNIASGILHAILWSLPGVGGLFGTLWTFIAAFIHLGLFIIMVIAMIKAFSGSRWDIPYVGPIARRQVGDL